MRLLITYLLLVSPLFLLAQGSVFSLIYELSNEAYEEKVRAKNFELTPEDCQVLVGSTDTLNWEKQPSGYYIEAKVIGEHLELTILDKTSIHAVLLNNERDFAVQVIDSLGQIVSPTKMFLNNKKVKQDKITNSYRLNKRKKGGLLRVEAKGQILFYEIKKEEIYNYRKRFRDRRFVYVLKAPIRAGKSVYYYFRRGVAKKNWRIYSLQRIVPFWRKFNKQKQLKGYIVTNQPIYRHGDTLKIKAYIAKENGEVWDEDLQLKISGYKYSKYKKLKPDEQGNITFEMRLGDSLMLDKTYNISVRRDRFRNKHYTNTLYHSFKLEDYQLDEVEYDFSSEQKEYLRGEKILLAAEGKDKNGLTISDGSVHVVAKRGAVHSIKDSILYIPDTLWSVSESLNARGSTQFILPDSLLPEAELDIILHATFTNSNGELHEKEEKIRYHYNPERYELALTSGQVMISHSNNQQSISDSVILVKYIASNKIQRHIRLPYQEKLNPYATIYYLQDSDGKRLRIIENYEDAKVQVFEAYKQNTVEFDISNPHGIPINYWISKGENIVSTGQTDSTYFHWEKKGRSHKAYYLRYQYVWKGNAEGDIKTSQHFENRLQITVEEPRKIIPGEQAQIKVKVTDAFERKVANVNLTAGAINAQFNSSGNVSSLNVPYKPAKALKKYGLFDTNNTDAITYRKVHPLTNEWNELFKLDTSLFYRLRFPEQAVRKEYLSFEEDSFYQNIAQFAPYIVENGKSAPIFMIYCNRKLVYYHETDDNTPYSFVGRIGYNNIVLRTRNYEYEMDSVLLKKGQKLEFTINAKLWEANEHIERRVQPTTLTSQEKQLLKSKLLFLKGNYRRSDQFVWQDTLSIHHYNKSKHSSRSSYNQPIILGPFDYGRTLNYLQPQNFGSKFHFESGYEYSISSRRERLYESKYFNRKIILPVNKHYKQPKEGLNKPSMLIYEYDQGFSKDRLSKSFRSEVKEGGGVQIIYENRKEKLIGIALRDNELHVTDQFYPNIRIFNKIPTHNHTFLLVNEAEEVYSFHFDVKKDSLLVIDFSNIKWQKASKALLRNWFPSYRRINKEEFSSLTEKILPSYSHDGYELQGIVTDETGEPLIGANILLKGTNRGTISDIDGNYTLFIPYDMTLPEIVVSYTGYEITEVELDYERFKDITLKDAHSLDEVIVVGYSSMRKSQQAVANLNTIEIRGYRVPLAEQDNTTAGQTITSEQIRRLPTSSIKELSVATAGLASADEGSAISVRGSRTNATDYYLDRIRVSGDLILEEELNLTTSRIRSNFQDYAYWNPTLTTDQKGEAYFTVTYPDNITSWNTFVVGMDKKLRAGVTYGNTKSYKPLLAQLATPRFLVEDDESDLIGKALNYTNDTLFIETKFELEGKEIKSNSTDLVDGFVEKIKVEAPKQSDSLHFQYQLQMGDYFDGEKRSISVVRRGMEAVKGTFEVLDRDTSLIYEPVLQSGEVKVFVEGSFLNSALRSLNYLVDYPYGCNEQTASRLLGLLMKKKIYAKLEQNFEQEAQITKMVKRLEKTQNADGSWGWWRDNIADNRMSIYVTKVLQIATTEGYPTTAVKKGLNHLTLNAKKYQRRLQVDALLVLAQSNVPFNFEDYLTRYDSIELNVHERLATIRMRQILNQEYSLDSLYHHRKRNTFGSTYWQQKRRYWYDRSKQATLLAYKILKAADKKEELKAIRQYFFQQRGRYIRSAWTNTYQTATILEAILPEILEETTAEGIQNEYFEINGDTIRYFPYKATFSSNQTLRLEKQGNSPMFFTAYQRYFETQPKRKDSLFDITSTLLQEGEKVNKLEQGKRVQLKIEVQVKEAAEYVMIEIPIPAACSYYSKPNGWSFPEVHREYFKEKTAIFCRQLEAGKYEFKLELEARFTGKYTLNPVRVEQMYFPVFDGNNELKKVVVK